MTGTTIHEKLVLVKMEIFPRNPVIQRVKIVRESVAGKGRTKKKFAEEILGISYTTYLEYEKNIVDLDFIYTLHHRFNYRLEWLLAGSGNPKND